MGKTLSELEIRILEKERIECDDVVVLLGDYTDQELSCTLKARLDSHISSCPFCKHMRDSYQWTVNLAHELKDDPVPREVQNRLRNALNERLGLSLPLVK